MDKALVRYVYPRHLTEEQIAIIGDYLAEHPAQQIGLQQPTYNEEASAYRADLQRALTRGGWTIPSVNVVDRLPEVLTIDVRHPRPDSLNHEGKDRVNPEELLRLALKQARVQIGSITGGNADSASLTLRIGRRRMDDSELRARQAELEMARKMLQSDEYTE